MRTRELADLLSAHAEGLNAGRDLAGDLLAKQPEAAPTLQPLLGLARRVTYLVGRDARIRLAFESQFNVGAHLAKVREALEA